MEGSQRLLDGIRVLDVGTFIFGPAAATVMSDFGAEVIKVEAPGIGDLYRHLYRMPPLPTCEDNYCWELDARNKKSLALDLKRPEAREILYRLVPTADVLVTNYQPSVLKTLGLTWDEIAPLNDRLVYAHATGYGDSGSEVEKPGYDASAFWARSGLMDAVRTADGDPAVPVAGMGDHPSSMSLFGAIMLALWRRERTGKGTRVTTSLMANGAWANGCNLQAALCGAEPYRLVSLDDPPNACAHLYQTRDDRALLLLLLQEDNDWPPFTRALERPDLVSDERFATKEARRKNARELATIVTEVFRARDFDDWRERLDRHRITFGVIAKTEELPDDPQMQANGVFAEVEGRPGLRVVNSPIWVDGVSKVQPRPAPELGQHTDEILASLGYDTSRIRELREAKAVA